MPFYEYQCKNCGHALEAMQKISEDPLKKCPHCGKSQLQRLMSAPVFRLKGGGWYETDFKDDKDKKKNLADSPEVEKSSEKESKAEKDAAPEAPDSKVPAKEPETPKKDVEKAAKPSGSTAKKTKSKPAKAVKKKSAKARKR